MWCLDRNFSLFKIVGPSSEGKTVVEFSKGLFSILEHTDYIPHHHCKGWGEVFPLYFKPQSRRLTKGKDRGHQIVCMRLDSPMSGTTYCLDGYSFNFNNMRLDDVDIISKEEFDSLAGANEEWVEYYTACIECPRPDKDQLNHIHIHHWSNAITEWSRNSWIRDQHFWRIRCKRKDLPAGAIEKESQDGLQR
jgi:hypothetical protein